jgi:hypothetical protein
VWEYALDTKNFHEPSHSLPIIPVLVPTRWQANELPPRHFAPDGVCTPIAVSVDLLPRLLDDLQREFPTGLDPNAWIAGRYKPTPTIIEATRQLYAKQSVAFSPICSYQRPPVAEHLMRPGALHVFVGRHGPCYEEDQAPPILSAPESRTGTLWNTASAATCSSPVPMQAE